MGRGRATASEVSEALSVVLDVCARLDPVAVPMHEVVEVFDGLAALERCAGGAVLRMAARYEEAGAWKQNGARSPEEDIARKTGTGTTRARRKLSTSKRLRSQPRTDDAVRRGNVSTDQADEVPTGRSVPGACTASGRCGAGTTPRAWATSAPPPRRADERDRRSAQAPRRRRGPQPGPGRR